MTAARSRFALLLPAVATVALALPAVPLRAEAAPRGEASTAYALQLWNETGDFVSHPVGDWSPTVLGTNMDLIVGMDFDPDGTVLYALNDDTNELGTLDLADGTFTAIGPTVPTAENHDFWGGFTIDPQTGTAYATSFRNSGSAGSALYTIDLATGAPTEIGLGSTNGMLALAMNCLGELYGYDYRTDDFYSISPETGEATMIGELTFNVGYAQDMDFDAATGILYAWLYDFGNTIGRYGTIDLETGAFSQIDPVGSTGEFSGAIRSTCTAVFVDGFESGDTSAWDGP